MRLLFKQKHKIRNNYLTILKICHFVHCWKYVWLQYEIELSKMLAEYPLDVEKWFLRTVTKNFLISRVTDSYGVKDSYGDAKYSAMEKFSKNNLVHWFLWESTRCLLIKRIRANHKNGSLPSTGGPVVREFRDLIISLLR